MSTKKPPAIAGGIPYIAGLDPSPDSIGASPLQNDMSPWSHLWR